MTTIYFKSCKIGMSIPLEKPAAFFKVSERINGEAASLLDKRMASKGGHQAPIPGVQKTSVWKEFIMLSGPQLEQILKKPCDGMYVYLFEFGCITFVNLGEWEIQTFLEFIAGMVDSIDYSMIARFSESHLLEIGDDGNFSPWEGSGRSFKYEEPIIQLIAIILAKSTALNKIETDVDENMDESGAYIDYLKRGRLRINKKTLSLLMTKFLKFEYEIISSIRIFERSVDANHTRNGRELYDCLAEYYEMNDRFDVLQRKIDSLRSTMKTYNSLSYRQSENRLYLFEIFLLGLFPAVSLVGMFFHFW
ncbi:MAG: hypothetical protein K0R57_3414 [Paenibacillaceae bacterium]|jgi:uncharacterized Rmd1/YagE family protein|nr:hypothetical protein [Paenibacillaceae bacterium]